MLRNTLLRPSLYFVRPLLTRTARRVALRRPGPAPATPATPTTTQNTVLHDIDAAADELSRSDFVAVEASPDLILLDHLNISRPGTRTDKRYAKQKKLMAKLESSDEKTKALVHFLLKEAEREVWHYPNEDELELEEMDDVKQKDLERGMEYELKRSTLNNWKVKSQRYKRFEVLVKVLENIFSTKKEDMIVPLEQLAKVFEIAQYLEDFELKQKTRYFAGKLIYNSGKVEFDVVNESLYIESLMEFEEFKEAERLLLKRDFKQRWWSELLVVNYIDQGRFDKAEETITSIKSSYGDYLDIRIYILFINAYLRAKNVQRCQEWTSQLMSFVASKGFLVGMRQEPGLGASEEATLDYLNREDQPTKDEFLEVISSYLKTPDLLPTAAQLISFYLKQPTTSSEDIALKLVEFRLHYKTKIIPLLSQMSDTKAVEYINQVFDQFRSLTPLQTEQGDIMDDFFQTLGSIGGFDRITEEMQEIVSSDQKLTDKHFYNLISALLKGGREENAFEVLTNLELSWARAMELPDEADGFVIPPVNPYHYMPFVRHFGRSGRMDELKKVLKRFNERCGVYNPALLTQLLNTFVRNQCYREVVQLINGVVLHDIHKQDELGDYRRLYSTVWSCLKDLATVRKFDEKMQGHANFPDYRVVFLKMIEDRCVPSATDYSMIVKAFVINMDFYPLPCIIQYMGKVHKCLPTPQLLKTIDKLESYNDSPPVGLYEETTMSTDYMQKLESLQAYQQQKKSLDPFSQYKEDTLVTLDQDPSPDSELLWRVALARVMDLLENMNADEIHLRRIHEQFGLVYDMDKIFAP